MTSALSVALGLFLLALAALKLIWPNADAHEVGAAAYYATTAIEAILGVLLLVPRCRRSVSFASYAFLVGVVGYGVARILSTGIGSAAAPCGCLGARVDPSRGVMLAIAAGGMAAAGWLSLSSASRRNRSLPLYRWLVPLGVGCVAILLGLGIKPELTVPADDPEPVASQPVAPVPEPELATVPARPPEPAVRPTEAEPLPPLSPPAARSRAVQVTVRGADSALAAAGADVWIPSVDGSRVKTDAQGTATLAVPDGLATEIVARSADGTWGRAALAASQSAVLIAMPDALRLAGFVIWEDGSPARNFEFEVIGRGTEDRDREKLVAPSWNDRVVRRRVRASEDGAFQVRGLTANTVGFESRDGRGVFDTGNLRGLAPGRVIASLPNTEMKLVVVAGRALKILARDAASAPVSPTRVTIDWDRGFEGFARFGALIRRSGTFRFLWPYARGALLPQLRGVVEAAGFERTPFVFTAEDAAKPLYVVLQPTASFSSVQIKKPWRGASVLHPGWRVYREDRSLNSIGVTESSDAWIFSDLPEGPLRIECAGKTVAAVSVQAGRSQSIAPDLSELGRLILKPVVGGSAAGGTVRLVLWFGGRSQIMNADIGPDGTIPLFPLPAGKTKVVVMQSNATSAMNPSPFEVPGEGKTIEITVKLEPRKE